jgi:NAD(P)-dependent dehydrogenase (short-subunit alcohol dehydrogenase family)
MARWTTSDLPPQHGRIALVTGTGGLGLEDALALARAGCDTIIAGRDPAKGAAALARIRREAPGAAVRFERCDLADLASVAACAARVDAQVGRLDLLVNNAAVMVPPRRLLTRDGFELQFGTNHLGHVALTAALLPLLRRGRAPRVVSVSSIAAPRGRIDFDDLQAERAYEPMARYAQSKLANLLFAIELQRRSDAGGWGVTSLASHPGIARTDLIHNGAGPRSLQGRIRSWMPFLFQPVERGALPTLYAATAPGARPGGYYGPDGVAGLRGYPTDASFPPRALDPAVAARLWTVSEELTGVRFDAAAPARAIAHVG